MLYIFLFSVCFLFLQVAFFLLTHFMCLQNNTHVCKINPRACERIFISLTQYEFRFIFRCAAVPYEDSEKSSLTFILSVCPARSARGIHMYSLKIRVFMNPYIGASKNPLYFSLFPPVLQSF